MKNNNKTILQIIGLELLVMFFYTANGAYSSISKTDNVILQYVGLYPLVIGLLIYLSVKKKWGYYQFHFHIGLTKSNLALWSPLLFVLGLICVRNQGLNTSSLSDLLFMFVIQIGAVAFIEELFFRGFMLKLLLSKGVKKAVIISSVLFGVTHSIQLLGGQSLEDTLLQIIYAFLVGLVLALLIVKKQSIFITILFHGLNNFLNLMGNKESSNTIAYIILAVFAMYAYVLWTRLKTKNH